MPDDNVYGDEVSGEDAHAPMKGEVLAPHAPQFLRGVNDITIVALPSEMQAVLDRVQMESDRRRLAAQRQDEMEYLARLRRNRRERNGIIADRVRDGVFYLITTVFFAVGLSQILDGTYPMDSDVRIVDPEVVPGGKLVISVENVVRHRFCEMRVSYNVYDGQDGFKQIVQEWESPPTHTVGPDLGYTRSVVISRDAVAGSGRIRITREWRCPLNIPQRWFPITETYPDMPFHIRAN